MDLNICIVEINISKCSLIIIWLVNRWLFKCEHIVDFFFINFADLQNWCLIKITNDKMCCWLHHWNIPRFFCTLFILSSHIKLFTIHPIVAPSVDLLFESQLWSWHCLFPCFRFSFSRYLFGVQIETAEWK